MSGLMIKDFKLIFQRKVFFLMLFVIAFFLRFQQEGMFSVMYLTMIMGIFAISTVNYDEFDNGYPFLMTLPFSRKTYVKGKYLFACALGVIGWLAGVAIFVVSLAERGELQNLAAHSEVLVYLPVFLLLIDIMLPLQLKFGAEKSRMVLFLGVGLVVALSVFGAWMFQKAGFSTGQALGILSQAGEKVLAGGFALAVAGVTLLSYCISVHVMERKEF